MPYVLNTSSVLRCWIIQCNEFKIFSALKILISFCSNNYPKSQKILDKHITLNQRLTVILENGYCSKVAVSKVSYVFVILIFKWLCPRKISLSSLLNKRHRKETDVFYISNPHNPSFFAFHFKLFFTCSHVLNDIWIWQHLVPVVCQVFINFTLLKMKVN